MNERSALGPMFRVTIAVVVSYAFLMHSLLMGAVMAPSPIDFNPDLAAVYTLCGFEDDVHPRQDSPADRSAHPSCNLCYQDCGCELPPTDSQLAIARDKSHSVVFSVAKQGIINRVKYGIARARAPPVPV